jgi:alliinase-like protein
MSLENDMFMVRSHVDGHNLSVGEPDFLQKNLDFLTIVEPIIDLNYPILGGEKELIEELHRLHPKFKYIVVTNGAKQGILAAIYALSQDFTFETSSTDRKSGEKLIYKHKVYGRKLVHHSAPFWPSFKTLTNLSGLSFTSSPDSAAIKIVTSPNNPNGSEGDDESSIDIWDAAYFNPLFPVYGHTKEFKATTTIFSGSKMFGVSGFRIGWLCTDDERIAKLAAQYVEATTTGVSLLSQAQMAGILRHARRFGDAIPEFKKSKKVLENNAEVFHESLDSYIDIYEGAPKGMFAFVKVKELEKFNNALKKAKVQVVPGHVCGMREEGWIRFSLGWQTEYLEKALIDLKKALND